MRVVVYQHGPGHDWMADEHGVCVPGLGPLRSKSLAEATSESPFPQCFWQQNGLPPRGAAGNL